MPSNPVRFDVQREKRGSGQLISVVALAPSGRVLGSVDVLVPLGPNFPIAERVGQAGEDAIIEKARELAQLVAEAVEAAPAQT